MRMTGKMSMGPGMEVPITMEMMRPNMFRMDFTFQGMTGTQAYDGAHGWALMPFQGKKDPEPLPDDMVKEMADQADFDGAMVDYKKKGHTVELIGKEPVEGTDAYKIKITKKNGNIEYVFLDAETFLQIRSEGKTKMRGQEIDGESSMSDYKEVEGIILAHSMQSGAKGSPQKQTITIDKVEVNPALDAAHFVMPAKADSTGGADSTAAKAKTAGAPAKTGAAAKSTTKKAEPAKSTKK
jgi:hypothetical protein